MILNHHRTVQGILSVINHLAAALTGTSKIVPGAMLQTPPQNVLRPFLVCKLPLSSTKYWGWTESVVFPVTCPLMAISVLSLWQLGRFGDTDNHGRIGNFDSHILTFGILGSCHFSNRRYCCDAA